MAVKLVGRYHYLSSFLAHYTRPVLYCQYCFWQAFHQAYRFCPYGHGLMTPGGESYAHLLDDILGDV